MSGSRALTPNSVFWMPLRRDGGDRERQAEAERQADRDLHDALPQHHAEDRAVVGAERHPHAELLRRWFTENDMTP